MRKVEDDEEEEEEEVCVHCGGTPCEWDEFGDELAQRELKMYGSQSAIVVIEDGSQLANNKTKKRLDNKEMRKSMYRMFTYLKYGHLGRGVRIPVPECIVAKIREKYPDPDEDYMGFMESAENERQCTTTSVPTPEPTSTSIAKKPRTKRRSSMILKQSSEKKIKTSK